VKDKNKNIEVNLLELVPVRNRKWEDGEGASVVILAPRFSNRWLRKLILPRLKDPFYRISLDDLGSWVWLQCNGSRTVAEIGQDLKKEFGDNAEPVYDRLGRFFRQMEEHLFIKFRNLPA